LTATKKRVNILHIDLGGPATGFGSEHQPHRDHSLLGKGAKSFVNLKYHAAVRVLLVEDDRAVLLFDLKGARG
jgi:hypothetical protein